MAETKTVSTYNNEHYDPHKPIYREIVEENGFSVSYVDTHDGVIGVLSRRFEGFVSRLKVREYSGSRNWCSKKYFAEHDALWYLKSYRESENRENFTEV